MGRLLDVIEAGYLLSGDDDAWLDRIAEAAMSQVSDGVGITAYMLRSSPDQVGVSACGLRGRHPPRSQLEHANAGELADADTLNRFYRTARVETAVKHISKVGGAALGKKITQTLKPYGSADCMGVVATDGGPEVLVVSTYLKTIRTPTSAERRSWGRVASHLTSALRMRRSGTDSEGRAVTDERHPRNEAIFTPTGRLEHARSKDKAVHQHLRDAVRKVDKARGAMSRRRPDEALELWQALCAGRWTLLDRFDADGRRYVVACENELPIECASALGRRELQVAWLASLGRSNGEIAYELGLTPSTVATHLGRAMRKLNLTQRVQLCTLQATLQHADRRRVVLQRSEQRVQAFSAPQACEQDSGLTAAERAVLKLLVDGLDNKSIARRRGTSPRTIANQVAAILRKTGSQSRAELAAVHVHG